MLWSYNHFIVATIERFIKNGKENYSMSAEEPPQNPDSDPDVLGKFYLETPTTETMIDVYGIKLVKIRSGQEMVYWRMGKIDHCPKPEGLRLIVGLAKLWGGGMVITVNAVRNEHI